MNYPPSGDRNRETPSLLTVQKLEEAAAAMDAANTPTDDRRVILSPGAYIELKKAFPEPLDTTIKPHLVNGYVGEYHGMSVYLSPDHEDDRLI